MRNDGWVAGVAALAVLSGLTGGLIAMAIRPAHLPVIEPAAGPASPADTGARPARPMLCVGAAVVCSAPQLPAGYPCSCMHPLHGTVNGRVASIDHADDALAATPGGGRRLDADDVFGP
ncbi:MAG TPA: hypothetical protein PKA13_15550 [Geminicoccaceae bacterium]|nr:hypothetical protein [Geminicoccus sp.]HMU51189.1 hypothetical protein [Geminicoccaceae bacterium]